MIYFIQAENGHIKIGFTDADDAMIRLASLQTGSPVPLKLLGTIPGTLEHEKDLHRRFAAHRVHGEWFKPVEDLLAMLPQGSLLSCGGAEVTEKSVAIRVLTVGRKRFTKTILGQLPRRMCIDWLDAAGVILSELPPYPEMRGVLIAAHGREVDNWNAVAKPILNSVSLQRFVRSDIWGWVYADPGSISLIHVYDGVLYHHIEDAATGSRLVNNGHPLGTIANKLFSRRNEIVGWRPQDQLFIGV